MYVLNMTPLASANSIIFPSQLNFECTSCGKCCRSSFEIPIKAHTVAKIQRSDPYRKLVREGYQPLRVLAESFHFLDYREDGTCHFLDSDQLCGLHKSHDPTYKPVICRLYPFNLVPTPDGWYASVLFSCPAVISGTGAPLEAHREELANLLTGEEGKLPTLPPVKQHILAHQEETVPWNQYLEWEDKLLDALNPQDPAQSLLKAARDLLPGSPKLQEKVEEFGNLALLYLEDCEDPELFFEQLCRGEKPYSERLQTQLSSFQLRAPSNRLVQEVLSRYLQSLIRGKLLVIGPTLFCRLVLVAVSLSILLGDLEVLAERDGELHFSFPHLEECFDTCETRLVAQSNDLEPYLLELEQELLS